VKKKADEKDREEMRKREKKYAFAFAYFDRMTVATSKKRKRLTFEGIKFPCFPSAVEVKESLSKVIVESLQNDPVTQPIE
jgi:hypothetical protein